MGGCINCSHHTDWLLLYFLRKLYCRNGNQSVMGCERVIASPQVETGQVFHSPLSAELLPSCGLTRSCYVPEHATEYSSVLNYLRRQPTIICIENFWGYFGESS